MRHVARLFLCFLIVVPPGLAAQAETWYEKIQVVDSGPFSVWNGHEDGAPADERVLAVIGVETTVRIAYNTTEVASPTVAFGAGSATVTAPSGAGFTLNEIKSGFLLTCANSGAGSDIICYCGVCTSPCECDDADTGIIPAGATVEETLVLDAD